MEQRSSVICSTCALGAEILLRNPRGEEKSQDCMVVLPKAGVAAGSEILKTMV